jgi:hypothetical protein
LLSSTASEQKPSSITSERKNKSENKEKKEKIDVYLLATNALIILQERFLQHHFSNVFCNTTLVALLQHTCATLSFVTTLQHSFCSTIFCNIDFALE